MNKPRQLASSWTGPVAPALTATDSASLEGSREFVSIRESDLPVFYRQFLLARSEPVFVDIFKPIPYQTVAQFIEYFSADKRPLWLMGPPEAPRAYFGLHYMLRQHDLANLDFTYFTGYPSPGSEDARHFWHVVRACVAERGLTRVQSFVIADSIDKIRLLESFGFRKEGVLREHYFHNGRMHDVVVHAWMAGGRRG